MKEEDPEEQLRSVRMVFEASARLRRRLDQGLAGVEFRLVPDHGEFEWEARRFMKVGEDVAVDEARTNWFVGGAIEVEVSEGQKRKWGLAQGGLGGRGGRRDA